MHIAKTQKPVKLLRLDDILDSFEELKTADNATQAQMVMYSKLFETMKKSL